MRKLKAEDILYFENEIIDVIKELISSLVEPSKGFICNEIMDFYIDFTREAFID